MKPLERKITVAGRFEEHVQPDGSVIYFDPEGHVYAGEIKASKRARGGFSFVKATRHTGISTVAKMLDVSPDPLMDWAVRLERQAIAEFIGGLTAAGKEIDWMADANELERALHEEGLGWRDQRDRMATRGTRIHESIFLALSTGKRPPDLAELPDEARGFGQAAFKWWRDHEPVPIRAEQSTLNAELMVAGTPDLLCVTKEGERLLVDAKTRERGVARSSDHVQLAGYELCHRSCGIGPSDRRVVLVLLPSGKYIEHAGVGTEEDFRAALAAYRQSGDLGKRMA